ncbi:spore germination protein GerPC [Cohnella mopanensis]|uniref:spore germination protein GerPC n=1 Tax=Cohnella mopanensis TaxID=2911966 RepID=UPI001EF9B363|nr:spore germination protein GerPC [Cohnella mopanensis]
MQMPMQQPYLWNSVYQQQPQAPVALNWTEWCQRLYQTEVKLQQLTEQLANVQKQLDEVRNKQPLHVEYHFDQLKVNRLEGTLNVGISPQGVQGIESFETPNPVCWNVNTEQTEEANLPIRALQKDMNEYMIKEAPAILIGMERQFGITLDEEHRRTILDDVNKQLNDRVRYYAKTIDYPDKGTDEERKNWNESVKDKTRRDIQAAFSAYLGKQLKKDDQNG